MDSLPLWSSNQVFLEEDSVEIFFSLLIRGINKFVLTLRINFHVQLHRYLMPSLYNVHTVPFYWGSAAEQSVNFFVPYASSSSCTSVHRAALYRYWWIFVILKNPLILRESWDCVIPVNPSWSCIMWFIFNFIKHNLLKDKRTYRATGKSLVFFIFTQKFSMHFSAPSFCGAYLCDDFSLSMLPGRWMGPS